MNFREEARFFDCQGDNLLGVLTIPERTADTGVVIVVGGPQYRVGGHRQFVLLSRALADAGFANLRFDYRGMGDSAGEARDFQRISDDISAAIDTLISGSTVVRKVVLWGLCDAASASLIYWYERRDARVDGVVLLNPWVRSQATLAKARVRHYYGQRLFAPEFWRKLLTGRLSIVHSVSELWANFQQSNAPPKPKADGNGLSFPQMMSDALRAFPGRVLLLLSGNDLTAREFVDCATSDPDWSGILESPRVVRHEIPDADHTFSKAIWRQDVERNTLEWLRML